MAEILKCNSCGGKSVTIICGQGNNQISCTKCGKTEFHYEEVSKNDI